MTSGMVCAARLPPGTAALTVLSSKNISVGVSCRMICAHIVLSEKEMNSGLCSRTPHYQMLALCCPVGATWCVIPSLAGISGDVIVTRGRIVWAVCQKCKFFRPASFPGNPSLPTSQIEFSTNQADTYEPTHQRPETITHSNILRKPSL